MFESIGSSCFFVGVTNRTGSLSFTPLSCGHPSFIYGLFKEFLCLVYDCIFLFNQFPIFISYFINIVLVNLLKVNMDVHVDVGMFSVFTFEFNGCNL